jgi:hypothetical protein
MTLLDDRRRALTPPVVKLASPTTHPYDAILDIAAVR